MSSKHTPGPWNHVSLTNVIVGPNRCAIAEVLPYYKSDDVFDDNQQIANARLIAAAPALLEACKATLADIDAGTSLNRNHPCIKQMCTAVSRATGKEPKQ